MEDVVTGSEEYDDNSEDITGCKYEPIKAEYDANRYSSKDDTWCRHRCDSVEAAEKFNRNNRGYIAKRFWRDCTFDSVLKTCILSSGDIYPWLDNSFGLTWVAVHGMDNSISVVTRHRDLDMTRVSPFYQTLPKVKVIYDLIEAITYEVEGLPYDDDFCERSGLSIKKPFGVVSVFPVTKKSDEETGQLASSVECDKDKAINFLLEKMKRESVITLDDAIKTALSGFKHLCLEELKAEEYWVGTWDGKGWVHHMKVPDIEKHLAVIYECSLGPENCSGMLTA